jgi:hypothetical protein
MTTHIKNLITELQKLFPNNKNDDKKKWLTSSDIRLENAKKATTTASKIKIA